MKSQGRFTKGLGYSEANIGWGPSAVRGPVGGPDPNRGTGEFASLSEVHF